MSKNTEEVRIELEEIAPILATLDKPKDIDPPKHYFENLPDEIWKNLKPKIKTKNSDVKRIPFKWIGLAASIILLVGVFKIYPSQQTTENIDVPVEQFVNYLMEDVDELGDDFMIQLESTIQEEIVVEEDELNFLLETDFQDIDDTNFEPFINTL